MDIAFLLRAAGSAASLFSSSVSSPHGLMRCCRLLGALPSPLHPAAASAWSRAARSPALVAVSSSITAAAGADARS